MTERARRAADQPPDPDGAMTIPSPCINLCRMSPETGYCEGCLRSLDEIARWGGADDAAKRRILAAVAQRRAALASVDSLTRIEEERP